MTQPTDSATTEPEATAGTPSAGTAPPTETPGRGPAGSAPSSPVREALATLRPQPFGRSSPHDAIDPIVEPQWAGIRVLVAIDEDGAVVIDEDGEPVSGHERIVLAFGVSSRAEAVILDGWITKQIVHEEGRLYGPAAVQAPSAGQIANRMFFGGWRNRTDDRTAELEADHEARVFREDDIVTFVATDLLWLDDEPLLDIPLLERRRLLDSILVESEVVRRGPYVRPPVERWIGSWRAQGFSGMTYKAVNSRYSPGVATKDWAAAPMPRR